MVRRSLRIGLRLGLLAGILVVLAKLAQSRRSSHEDVFAPAPTGRGEDPWPPVQPAPVEPEPPAPTLTERIPPVKKAAPEAAPAAAPAADAPSVPPAPPRTPGTAPTEAAPVAKAAPAAKAAPEVPAPPRSEQARPGTPAPETDATPATGPAPEAAAAPDPPPVADVEDVADGAEVAEVAVEETGAEPPTVPPMAPADVDAGGPTAGLAPVTDAPTPARRRVRKQGSRRAQPWVEPVGIDCPASHPVKAKLASMLYHLPGMAAYNRTRPDRCYADADTAEADGFTRAKR